MLSTAVETRGTGEAMSGLYSSTNPNLDFLRSVAVVLVIVDHTLLAYKHPVVLGIKAEWLGLSGVWMFFVHTSLVLMWSLERRPYTVDFYVRRIFRIYPLACAAIAAVVLTHARVTGYGHELFDYTPFTRANVLATGLLIYNLFPGYSFKPIEYVIWSLPLEIDMYVLLPVLFAFARRDRKLLSLMLMWVLAVAVVIPFDSGMDFLVAIPDFLPGIMAYVLFKRVKPRLPFWTWPIFLAVALTGVMLRSYVSTGWLFCLALGCSLPYFEPLSLTQLKRASHTVAKYSYGAYIAHPFGLLLGAYFLRAHSVALQLVIELLTIVVVSVGAYHLLEKPMMDLGAKVAGRLQRRFHLNPL